MTKIILGTACTISGANPDQAAQIKNALTLDNPAYLEAVKMKRYTGKLDRHLHYFKETEAGLEIPRGATGLILPIIPEREITDNSRALGPVDFEFKGTLRPYQQTAVDAFKNRNFGVLEAATGSGKTTMALALIAKRKQPTIIIVHNKALLFQWRDRVKHFLGVEAGLIGDGKYDIRPVTVGIINSVKKHLDELSELFGHLVVDECHKSPSKTFTDAVSAFDCQYLTGLTATPERRDGLGKVINFYLGRIAHQVDKRHLNDIGAVLRPEIVQIETGFSYDYNDDYTQMLTAATEDEARSSQIVNEAIKHRDQGTTLLVSDRVNHCLKLAALLSARNQEPAILTGKTPKKKRLQIVADVQAGKVKFLVSTLSLISEGFDCSDLYVLVLATPVSFEGRITQTVGRILRPEKGKRPLVLDFADNLVGILREGAKKRLRILNNL